MSLAHTSLTDQPTAGPYQINATISYGGPIGSFANAKVFFSGSGLPYSAKQMLPTGNPDEYGAQLPKLYGVVRYYIQATDSYGGTQVPPPGAPTYAAYTFFGGPAQTLASDNMELPDGWTVGYAPDVPVAVTGTWVRAVPVASEAQLGTNHTPAGSTCWVTGN